ncbi:MAG: hypothetical protein LC126_27780 [Bryobacterales bacterium]|nr:hypothetical protein [Bryobacterales bacterium]
MPAFVPFLLRWTARLSAIFVAGTYILFVAGELFSRPSAFPTQFREWSGIFLLTAACAGMILAWRRELTGALVSLITLAAFGVLIPMGRPAVLFIAAAPGTLYLMDWLIRRNLMGPVEV